MPSPPMVVEPKAPEVAAPPKRKPRRKTSSSTSPVRSALTIDIEADFDSDADISLGELGALSFQSVTLADEAKS